MKAAAGAVQAGGQWRVPPADLMPGLASVDLGDRPALINRTGLLKTTLFCESHGLQITDPI